MNAKKLISILFALCISCVLFAFVSSAECNHIPSIGDPLEPTCTEPGHTAGTWCALCDEVLIPEEEIKPLGHDYTLVVTQKLEPTCIDYGREARLKCSRCDATKGGERIDKTDYHFPKAIPAVAPTCTQTGLTEGSECKYCGIIILEQEVVESLGGHIDENYDAHCDRCDEELPSDFSDGCGAMPHQKDVLGLTLRLIYTIIYRILGIDNRCCSYLPWLF